MSHYGNEAPGAPSLQAELAKVREENMALKSLRQENEALCRVSDPTQFCCWLHNYRAMLC